MNNDINGMLSKMLSNPDALKEMASSLGMTSAPATTNANQENDIRSMLTALNNTDDKRISLLTALKPYLNSSRAREADKAIRLLKLTKISQVIRSEVE